MTQIVVTLEKGADENLLRNMIENMKGVLRTKVTTSNAAKGSAAATAAADEWIRKMKKLSGDVDSSCIDLTDERTRYIMSR